MERERILRRALWASAFFNLGGALMFAFPASVGQLAGLPVPVPPIYSVMIVMFVLLFGGSYAWLARQPRIVRPMVAMAAIGKASAFATFLVFWFLGHLPGLAVLAISGDLAFAVVFAWCLSADRVTVPAGFVRDRG
jgi:hypothetical protein